MEETQDAEEIIERIAALDIGKAELVCCVRLPNEDRPGKRLQEVTTHTTMTRSVLSLADRLRCLGVTRVVMEATSDYWKPIFYILEAAGFETWLVNARDVKHLPGRPKTDRLDAIWLCKVAERQMIRPSFVPPPQIRELRDLTRYRCDLVAVRTAEKNRAEKLLEDAQIKLSVVASDIFGVSGRAMMAALIAGERTPMVLAQMARSSMRAKISALEEAFTGRFTDHHAFLLATMLARVDQISADIAEVDAKLEGLVAPFAGAVERLDEVPGIGRTAAHMILAEIGLDMSRFPTAPGIWPPGRASPPESRSRLDERRAGARPVTATPTWLASWAKPPSPREDQHLPRRALPPHRPTPRQEESHRRGRPLHPHHHLAPAIRCRRTLHRPGRRLLRHPHRPRTQETQPHPPARSPRLPGHLGTRSLTG